MIPIESSSRSGHALVIGATGMLSAVSRALVRTREAVTVIARSHQRLDDLSKNAGGRLHPLALDYADRSALATGLAEARRRHGSPGLAVVWMHDHALGGLPVVVESLTGADSRLFLVRGSASAAPNAREHPAVAALKLERPALLREIVLGWMPNGTATRWLTHDEISTGVLAAITRDRPRHPVGTTTPWAARP